MHFKYKDTYRLKVRDRERNIMLMLTERKWKQLWFNFRWRRFQRRKIMRDKEDCYVIIVLKRSILKMRK
jgi:hypothetical protein